jgi:hypothetical protein
VDHGSGRDAAEDSLAVEQSVHAGHRLLVRDEHLTVELREVEDRRHVAVVERAQSHHGIAGKRLGGRDDEIGEALSEPVAGAHQRAPGAEAGDQRIDAVERFGNLGAGPLVMGARVGLIPVLERHEVAGVGGGHLQREPDGTV